MVIATVTVAATAGVAGAIVIGSGTATVSVGAGGAAATTTVASGVGGAGAIGAGSTTAAVVRGLGYNTLMGLAGTVGNMGPSGLIAMGPSGWITIGANCEPKSNINWDCWKPILHEEDNSKSTGILLKELAADERVKTISFENDNIHLTVENIWNEKFQLSLVQLPEPVGGGIAFHAERI
uniref:Uncharacterized protein n=1 Tax=Clytia hemisphaerica TaxID=252671 RepID=A0A7M5WM94_9CNID|eukprot:TCONS_00052878-protein